MGARAYEKDTSRLPYSVRLFEFEREWEKTHANTKISEASVKILKKTGITLERPRSPQPEKKELMESTFKVAVPRDNPAPGQLPVVDEKTDSNLTFKFEPLDQQKVRRPRNMTKAEEHAPHSRLAVFPHVRMP